MLKRDLLNKHKKKRRKKQKPPLDYRRCQLQKLVKRLEQELTEQEYQKACCQMVVLQQAHGLKERNV